MDIKNYDLDSLYITSVVKPGAPLVAFRMSIDLPPQNTPQRTATELLYTDLLLSGAGTRNRQEFLDTLRQLGAQVSLSVHEHTLTMSVTALPTRLAELLSLLGDMLESPHFRAAEFVRAKKMLAGNLALRREDARTLSHDGLCRLLLTRSARRYPWYPEELLAVLPTVTRAAVRPLHKSALAAPWTVTVGGSSGAVNALLAFFTRQRRSALHPTILPHQPDSPFGRPKQRFLARPVPGKQNIEFSLGGPAPFTLRDPEAPAFLFGLTVLGKWGGFAGRLMSTVREKEGLTYGIYAHCDGLSTTESGYWRIMTFFAPDAAARGLAATLREVNAIASDGITSNEHARFRTILETGERLIGDHLAATVSHFHAKRQAGFTYLGYRTFLANLLSVSRREVNKALKRHLNSDLAISAAGPTNRLATVVKNVIDRQKLLPDNKLS